MSIEWLEAESAIDERLALKKQREKLESAYDENPKDAEAALRLLNVLDQLGMPAQEMAQKVEPAFEANPDDPALMAWLGQLAYRMGQFKLAMLTLKHAMERDPDDTLANFSLGQLMLYAGSFEDAFRYAERAWATGVASYYRKEIARLYCIALARLKRFEEALTFQQEQLGERPDDSQTIIDTSDLLSEMGRNSESFKLLTDAVEKKPADTDLLFRLGVLRAVVCDVPMPARYGSERSNLHVGRAIGEFGAKHVVNTVKRIFYNYYLRNFNIASIEIVLGVVLMTFGTWFGASRWLAGIANNVAQTSGTVMVAALPVIVGFQLVLAALTFDLQNVPREVLHKRLAPASHKP